MTDTPRDKPPTTPAPSDAPESGPPPVGPAVIGPPMQVASDVDIRSIGRFLVALVVGLMLVAGVVYLQVVWLGKRIDDERPPAAFRAGERLPPPAPTLQTSPRDEMRALRTAQEAELTKSAWVDLQRRIVQIPIDRAIKRLVKEGLPNWPPVKPDGANAGPSVPSGTSTAPAATGAGAPAAASAAPTGTATPRPTASGTPTPTTPPERQP
jgi:hypothetical protein